MILAQQIRIIQKLNQEKNQEIMMVVNLIIDCTNKEN